jgi:coenzyme PQQ biosynthesis protein PqqD
MEHDDKPLRKTGYLLENMDDELLLYHPAETKVMYCNQTASLIWQLCDGERTVQEIVDLLADAYPESAEEIAHDVRATLQQFTDHGAIHFA